jgi:transposase
MGRRPKLTTEVKVEIVERYLQGEGRSQLSHVYGFHVDSLRVWVKKYQENGVAGLTNPEGNQYSPVSLKSVLCKNIYPEQEYLSGKGSELDLALRYGVPARGTVSSWIKQYNSHGACNSYLGGRVRMTRGRKTTLSERIDVVEHCINHKFDYTRTAVQFQVSYAQVYAWVKKYNERGVAALKDNRGRGRPLDDMNELERLQAENKLLKAKARQLEMENDVLKKVEELERGRGSHFSGKR